MLDPFATYVTYFDPCVHLIIRLNLLGTRGSVEHQSLAQIYTDHILIEENGKQTVGRFYNLLWLFRKERVDQSSMVIDYMMNGAVNS